MVLFIDMSLLRRAPVGKIGAHTARRGFSICSAGFPKAAEADTDLVCEELRLLPRCEVSTLRKLVVVDEIWICLFSPGTRCLVEFVREDANRDRHLDPLRSEECELVLPVKPCGRNAGICQPEQRHV